MSSRVLGVDACKVGWVGVVLHDAGATVHVAKTIAALVADAEVDDRCVVIGIDIPIGLPDTGRRRSDVLAYQLVGPRRVVGVYDAGAGRVGGRQPRGGSAGEPAAGRGGGLCSGVRASVEDLRGRRLGPTCAAAVVEVHPEVSFARLAGGPLPDGKPTWAGAHYRRRLLAKAEIELADDVGQAGRRAARR